MITGGVVARYVVTSCLVVNTLARSLAMKGFVALARSRLTLAVIVGRRSSLLSVVNVVTKNKANEP
jgi:hypothetical protein